ncbi:MULTISPECIES: hypothetical protein [unclassified Bradyrhizobium]|uniref:hypothetical protein n=1 Tax=unclassified Bradyrhizobium TaxID=2631580 RepID=UPI0020B29F7E|nr:MULTISPECIES: hypothetical protein [unclassified Bradyrhizobium]MCP3380141.1 hypothetical protein [Bradyrhizobium sp. CCGUVB4N]MCP3441002.1 hypothetical protein [Bradyrhizobium sp. CCGUVB14]
MAGAIENVTRTNSDSDSSSSAADRQNLESAFGSVLSMVAIQSVERNMEKFHETVAETEEEEGS